MLALRKLKESDEFRASVHALFLALMERNAPDAQEMRRKAISTVFFLMEYLASRSMEFTLALIQNDFLNAIAYTIHQMVLSLDDGVDNAILEAAVDLLLVLSTQARSEEIDLGLAFLDALLQLISHPHLKSFVQAKALQAIASLMMTNRGFSLVPTFLAATEPLPVVNPEISSLIRFGNQTRRPTPPNTLFSALLASASSPDIDLFEPALDALNYLSVDFSEAMANANCLYMLPAIFKRVYDAENEHPIRCVLDISLSVCYDGHIDQLLDSGTYQLIIQLFADSNMLSFTAQSVHTLIRPLMISSKSLLQQILLMPYFFRAFCNMLGYPLIFDTVFPLVPKIIKAGRGLGAVSRAAGEDCENPHLEAFYAFVQRHVLTDHRMTPAQRVAIDALFDSIGINTP